VGVRQPAMKQQPFNREQKIKGVTQTQPEKKEKKTQNPFPLSASTQPKKFHDVIHMVFELYEKGIIVKHQ
jgi:hypothetical protein